MSFKMSWLRNSPLRTSFSKQRSRNSPPKDADPSACYDSFCKHWQQIYEIILHTTPPKGIPSQDDVLGVVNHLDQMVTLLVLDLRESSLSKTYRRSNTATHSPCLEYLLSENLLAKLYEWSLHTGRFNNAVRLEQFKLYELLVSHNGALLAHEPVARPLLQLLEECENDIMPSEVEKKLVVVLNQLCVALMQNMALLDLFFHSTPTGKSKFIIFTLLIPHVHREGGIGQQARDAMLLCMSLSKKNDAVGLYIAEHSNICPVLATGLSGLYSLLPRKLEIEADDWHRLTPDDINDLPALTQLMNSLEFCNAVAQVAHPRVQKQLLEFLYQGFLVPVMGPALLQDTLGLTLEQLDAQQHWVSTKYSRETYLTLLVCTTVEELVAATAYFDLFLRSVTEPGLLKPLVKFLLEDNYDECRILDNLIKRISSRSRLCIVTLALFETLVDLNCEDVMLELCLGALNPCSHVMFSQRKRLRDTDPFGRAAAKFLSLTPSCCSTINPNVNSSISLPDASLYAQDRSSSTSDTLRSLPVSVYYNARSSDSLYGNYHAYLCDARQKITSCRVACANWSCRYDGEVVSDNISNDESILTNRMMTNKESNTVVPYDLRKVSLSKDATRHETIHNNAEQETNNMSSDIQQLLSNDSEESTTENESFMGRVSLSAEEQAKLDADIAELLNENIESLKSKDVSSVIDKKELDSGIDDGNTMNSLLSLDSSGYESFAFKDSCESTPNNESISENTNKSEEKIDFVQTCNAPPCETHCAMKENVEQEKQHIEVSCRPGAYNGKPDIGIFLDIILRKLECMTSNNIYVNLHLTGLISRLAIYPQPLLQSFLLNHSLVFQPSIRSLFQVLASLKHKIDQFLYKYEDVGLLVEQARIFLISRENRIVNARKNVLEAAAHSMFSRRNSTTSDIFSRGEPKRRSLTSSFTQIFRRSSSGFDSNNSLGNTTQPSSISESQLEMTGGRVSHGYCTNASWESPNEVSPVQNVVLCAVLLDEWLKELAAITQEHAVMSLASDFEQKIHT